jgi:OmpA-OmpF porin, OOP family
VNGTTKFIVGGVVTSLMAMASHSALGFGNGFITKLEGAAQSTLGNAGGAGVNLAFERDPSLRRFAILSGPADAATRERLLAAVRAVPGIAGARWADDGGAALVAAPAEAPATAEAVASCQTQVDAAIAGKTINFATASAEIAADSTQLIDAIAAVLTPCAGMTIEVAGHTDASGVPSANQTLSEARANAVMAALTAKGVPAGRLIARGYGSANPKAEGRSAAADAINRRIEFNIDSVGASEAASAAAPAAEGN